MSQDLNRKTQGADFMNRERGIGQTNTLGERGQSWGGMGGWREVGAC